MEINKNYFISTDPKYTAPWYTTLQRTTLDKIIEIWRYISSGLSNQWASLKETFSSIGNLKVGEGSDDGSRTIELSSFPAPRRNRIQRGDLLNGSDINKNTQTLENISQQDVPEFAGKIIFKPYVIEGWPLNHIVFLAANPSTKEIIFYDSKGWSLKDYNDQGLLTTYEKLKENRNDFQFVQNIHKDQYDTFNCGVYVLKRIELLSQNPNMSFGQLLEENPLSYADVMQARQDEILH